MLGNLNKHEIICLNLIYVYLLYFRKIKFYEKRKNVLKALIKTFFLNRLVFQTERILFFGWMDSWNFRLRGFFDDLFDRRRSCSSVSHLYSGCSMLLVNDFKLMIVRNSCKYINLGENQIESRMLTGLKLRKIHCSCM